MVRALASRKRRSRVTRKLDATMKAKPRKKRIVRVCRVASTSIERLHLWPSPPVNAMLCTMPSNSSARIGSAAGGMFTSSRRSTVILIAHNSRIPISINSKMAIDQGSTAPCAKAVKDKTTIKPTAMDWSRRDCRGGLRPPTVSVKGGLPDFSNVEIVKLVAGVRRRVHTIHGLYLPANASGLRRRIFAMLERLQMAPAHIVLSQNSEDIETATREHLVDPARLRPLGNGIDLERFHPRNMDRRADVRRALAIPDGHIVVGMIGRLVREKGYPELFEAALAVRAQRRDVTFIAIGGPEPSKADALTAADIDRWRLGDGLRMLGHRDDVPDLIGAMDVLVLPSHREGFPRSIMEAAATGVPVVATDIRGSREAVVDGEPGFPVPPRD